jgi:tripartite-type tricarboxylate transporter receptor subunit TctC
LIYINVRNAGGYFSERGTETGRIQVNRRRFVAGSTAAAVALTIRSAFAEDAYPSHAITVINAFPPGGAGDVAGRPFVAALEPIVKQPVVIENKVGAAGAVGAQVAAHAKPDGYTLLLHLTSISGFAEVDKLFGRPVKFTRADFIPIARLVADPCVLLVNDQQPYKTLAELTEDAKKRPNEIIFASSGLYGALHIPTALYMKAAGGLKLRHLPTNGGGPALISFLGNNAQVLVSSVSASLAQIKTGKARPLALFGAKRSKALPDVPTMNELGYNVEYYLWTGLFAPKGTPEPIIAYLRTTFRQAASSEQYKTAMANVGLDVEYLDQPEFAEFWDADATRIEDAIRAIGRVQG